MKFSEIAQKSEKELQTLLTDSRKQLAEARIELRTKQVSNVKQVAALKQTIAQVLTAQRQRELTKEEANG